MTSPFLVIIIYVLQKLESKPFLRALSAILLSIPLLQPPWHGHKKYPNKACIRNFGSSHLMLTILFCWGQRWQEATGTQWALWDELGKGNEPPQNKSLHDTLKRNCCCRSLVAPLTKEVREKESLTLRDQEHPKSSPCFQWDLLQWTSTLLWELSHTPVQDTLSSAF